jgi:enoyl-CoA hydratase
MAEYAHIGSAPSRIYGLPTTAMWLHRLTLEHAKQFLLTGRAIDNANANQAPVSLLESVDRQVLRH